MEKSKEEHITVAIQELAGTLVGIFFMSIFFYVFFVILLNPSEVGSYPARKQPDGSLVPLNRTVYKVDPRSDTIIYWMPGIYETPRKIVNCVIRDDKNWIGYYPDGSGPVEMQKGKIVNLHPINLPDGSEIVYVGKYHWWMLHLETQYERQGKK